MENFGGSLTKQGWIQDLEKVGVGGLNPKQVASAKGV